MPLTGKRENPVSVTAASRSPTVGDAGTVRIFDGTMSTSRMDLFSEDRARLRRECSSSSSNPSCRDSAIMDASSSVLTVESSSSFCVMPNHARVWRATQLKNSSRGLVIL